MISAPATNGSFTRPTAAEMKMFLTAEKRKKLHEAIVPVVIAWNCVDGRPSQQAGIGIGECPVIRITQLPLICFLRSIWIDFIAAHDQYLAAWCRLAVDGQLFLLCA